MSFYQLTGNIRQSFFRFLAISNVFSEDQNPSYRSAGGSPRPNLPTNPSRPILPLPAILVCLQSLSRFESTTMCCRPAGGKVRKDFVVRTPKYLQGVEIVVR